MVPSIVSERISTESAISHESGKGGEKRVASEWEELEKLSKEELIIELVRERNIRRIIDWKLRNIVEIDHPADVKIPVILEGDEDDQRHVANDEWAYAIALYAYRCAPDKDDFSPYDLHEYGLDLDQSEEAYRKLRVNGIVTNTEHDLEGWF